MKTTFFNSFSSSLDALFLVLRDLIKLYSHTIHSHIFFSPPFFSQRSQGKKNTPRFYLTKKLIGENCKHDTIEVRAFFLCPLKRQSTIKSKICIRRKSSIKIFSHVAWLSGKNRFTLKA